MFIIASQVEDLKELVEANRGCLPGVVALQITIAGLTHSIPQKTTTQKVPEQLINSVLRLLPQQHSLSELSIRLEGRLFPRPFTAFNPFSDFDPLTYPFNTYSDTTFDPILRHLSDILLRSKFGDVQLLIHILLVEEEGGDYPPVRDDVVINLVQHFDYMRTSFLKRRIRVEQWKVECLQKHKVRAEQDRTEFARRKWDEFHQRNDLLDSVF
jgi:hypothetical protein